jgi:uncharacterized protein YbaP (TraB family)
MLIRLLALALCVLWLSTSHGQVATPAPAGEPSSTTLKRGFLWEARKGERHAYLLGTIHVGKAEFYPMHPERLARLQEVAVIAVEADVSEAARVGVVVQKLAYYGNGAPGLDARVPALRSRLEDFAKRNGLTADLLWRMKPWMVANTIVVIEAMRLGVSPAYATEAFLFDFARKSGKPIVEIESIEAQLRLFDSAPETTQFAYLQQAIDSIDDGTNQDEITQLVNAWEKHDGAQMERLLAKMRGAQGVAERFVVEQILEGRHPRMIDAIERYVASGKLHLVAIGSLHFFGPNGLIELLRQRGYTVVPLP